MEPSGSRTRSPSKREGIPTINCSAHRNKETAKQCTVSVFMMSDNWESSFSLQKEPSTVGGTRPLADIASELLLSHTGRGDHMGGQLPQSLASRPAGPGCEKQATCESNRMPSRVFARPNMASIRRSAVSLTCATPVSLQQGLRSDTHPHRCRSRARGQP